jgi:PEP-CTERM motif
VLGEHYQGRPVIRQRGKALGFVAAAVALLFVSCPHARASLWDWSWSDNANTASGTLTTDDLSAGSYTITAATGTWDGISITGLAPYSSCCAFAGPANDNLLFAGSPQLDLAGITFDIPGDQINLYYDTTPVSYYLLDQMSTYAHGQERVAGVFSAAQVPTAVPEPSSLALFAPALLGLAFFYRRKRA